MNNDVRKEVAKKDEHNNQTRKIRKSNSLYSINVFKFTAKLVDKRRRLRWAAILCIYICHSAWHYCCCMVGLLLAKHVLFQITLSRKVSLHLFT